MHDSKGRIVGWFSWEPQRPATGMMHRLLPFAATIAAGLVGFAALAMWQLRRLGPQRFADRVMGRQIIEWSEVQYLASAAPVQLKVSYDRLSELNPVDLARIVGSASASS